MFFVCIYNICELIKFGVEKCIFYFDFDVINYLEGEDVDFKVGGVIGVFVFNEVFIV